MLEYSKFQRFPLNLIPAFKAEWLSKFEHVVESGMLQKEIEDKLREYQDPYLGKDLVAAKAIKRLIVDQKNIELEVTLGYPFRGYRDRLYQDLQALLAPFQAGKKVQIKLSTKIEPHVGREGIPGLKNIKNIIAVGSGKGGVGKSTIAINLALALAKEGATVGILDADIYGPSQPAMLGAIGEKPVFKNGFLPIERHGLQSMSIGYLIDQTAPMVWRGPMIGKALQQLLQDTKWEDLDYLVVDLPPGTGDIQLTLCQKIPVSGALIVTTPQDLALLDVARACEMFNKLGVPLLGVIENMSIYHCSQCGHGTPIFGSGGAAKLAKQFTISVLGSVPLDVEIRELTDNGQPPITHENNKFTAIFSEMARKVAARLALQAKDYSVKFPNIIVTEKRKEES